MWFRSLADSVRPRPSCRPARRVPRPAKVLRLWLESLEDRAVPRFLPPVNHPTGTNPLAVVTADLNGDGRLDLITSNTGDNTISVRLGNGDSTFQAAQSYQAVQRPRRPVPPVSPPGPGTPPLANV